MHCALALTFNFVISIIYVDILLGKRQDVVYPQLGLSECLSAPAHLLSPCITCMSRLSFQFYFCMGSKRITSISLLQKERKDEVWLLLSLPLAVFLSQFIGSLFNFFPSLVSDNPVFYGSILTLMYAVSRPAGGVLFGLAFWIVSKHIAQDSPVRQYLIRSGYGFTLLFVSNQVIVLVTTSFPPFGIVTTSVLPIASYLVLTGIYSTALSVAQDVTLRRFIKRALEKELLFLDSIAVAQIDKQVQNKVLGIAKKLSSEIKQETGIENSMTDEDLKLYISEAIKTKQMGTKAKEP